MRQAALDRASLSNAQREVRLRVISFVSNALAMLPVLPPNETFGSAE
jgi:hypothetical protein